MMGPLEQVPGTQVDQLTPCTRLSPPSPSMSQVPHFLSPVMTLMVRIMEEWPLSSAEKKNLQCPSSYGHITGPPLVTLYIVWD